MGYIGKAVKWLVQFVQGAFEIVHIVLISALVGTGLAYGALAGIGVYAALHGS